MTLFFIIPFGLNSSKAQLTPHEWLEVIFEDSLGWVDSVEVGFSEYATTGIDTLFNEVELPDDVPSRFFVRIENQAVGLLLKKDIRFGNRDCYDQPEAWPQFYIRLYNATFPVKAKIFIHRDSTISQEIPINYPDSPLTCGCFNDIGPFNMIPHTVWLRTWLNINHTIIGGSDYYPLNPLIDILPANAEVYIIEIAPWGISPYVAPVEKNLSQITISYLNEAIALPYFQDKKIAYSIATLGGKVIENSFADNGTINIKHLSVGLYFLTISFKNNIYYLKFIKT